MADAMFWTEVWKKAGRDWHESTIVVPALKHHIFRQRGKPKHQRKLKWEASTVTATITTFKATTITPPPPIPHHDGATDAFELFLPSIATMDSTCGSVAPQAVLTPFAPHPESLIALAFPTHSLTSATSLPSPLDQSVLQATWSAIFTFTTAVVSLYLRGIADVATLVAATSTSFFHDPSAILRYFGHKNCILTAGLVASCVLGSLLWYHLRFKRLTQYDSLPQETAIDDDEQLVNEEAEDAVLVDQKQMEDAQTQHQAVIQQKDAKLTSKDEIINTLQATTIPMQPQRFWSYGQVRFGVEDEETELAPVRTDAAGVYTRVTPKSKDEKPRWKRGLVTRQTELLDSVEHLEVKIKTLRRERDAETAALREQKQATKKLYEEHELVQQVFAKKQHKTPRQQLHMIIAGHLVDLDVNPNVPSAYGRSGPPVAVANRRASIGIEESVESTDAVDTSSVPPVAAAKTVDTTPANVVAPGVQPLLDSKWAPPGAPTGPRNPGNRVARGGHGQGGYQGRRGGHGRGGNQVHRW